MTNLTSLLLLAAVLVANVYSVVIKVENLPESCDFNKCTKPDADKINVHLVPHTHDDVGWLKTVDQYYYGSESHYQKAGVQYIIDSVIQELIQNPARRFIYVETAFFWKWWLEQNEDTRSIVKELVKTGQLEFINGGWSMADEAGTHYNSVIDSTTWGHRKLKDTFGKCGVPKVTWQVDPFGHSREFASLFAQMNFDAVYFGREDYQDHDVRRANKTLEHVWQGSDDLGTAGDIFTGMMDMGYGPPGGFNWDLVGGGDEPVIDNPDSEEYNVDKIVEKMVNSAKDYQKKYATNNLMYPMGTDFQYQDAHVYYKNIDKLIKHVNEKSKEVKVFYSTPSCYTKAVNEAGKTFTGKNDDYFPYASDPHAYWTGYFTSRPALKYFERLGNNLLQACKQLDTLATKGTQDQEVSKLKEAMGIMQHHDAVAGTEKQHVANDYAKLLNIGIVACRDVLSKALTSLASDSNPKDGNFVFCDHLNISSCEFTEKLGDQGKESENVLLYNPLAHEVKGKQVRLPVKGEGKFFSITSSDGKIVVSALVDIPEAVRKLSGRNSEATHDLVFNANLPALGYTIYKLNVANSKADNSATVTQGQKISKAVELKGKGFTLKTDAGGQVTSVHLESGEEVALRNSFSYYKGHNGENRNSEDRASGAYIFRPDGQDLVSAGKVKEAVLYTNADGSQEIHQTFDTDYLQQVIRVTPDLEAIEFEYLVGPVPVNDNVGKEIVTLYTTDLKNEQKFYTDANGRQVLERKLNYRPTWKLRVEEPVAGNYYPVNSRIYARDVAKGVQVTVLNDRSQGGTVNNGTLELMVHRRLLHDDAFGVGEALSEPGLDGKGLIIRGRHLVVVSSVKKASAIHRELGQHLYAAPIVGFNVGVPTIKSWSALVKPLPDNVHLLTLESWADGQVLLRLEHFYQNGEDEELSKPVNLNLGQIFNKTKITSAKEVTLSANQDVSAYADRLTFKYTPVGKTIQPADAPFDPKTLDVTLNPFQIRSFLLKIESNL